MIHHMRLQRKPFDMIQSGEKTIELRLFDEKRQDLEVGDEIVFSNVEDEDEFFKAKIVGLYVFDSFAELYKKLPLLKCGYTSENLHAADPKDMNRYYSIDEQEKNGVVGIELEVLPSIFKLKYYNCFGDVYGIFSPQQLGQLQKNILDRYDSRIADLFYLILGEGTVSCGEELFELEQCRNTATDNGESLLGHSATIENGAMLTSVERVKDIFSYIWRSWLFLESTDMDWEMIQFFKKMGQSQDIDEILFWSYRFQAWGGGHNPLPYTLYKAIIDGRFERFYDMYPEWEKLCRDNLDCDE